MSRLSFTGRAFHFQKLLDRMKDPVIIFKKAVRSFEAFRHD